MKLETIISELARLKGTGAWARIAAASSTDYTTISRIARREMPNPGVLTCERIADALQTERVRQPGSAACDPEAARDAA